MFETIRTDFNRYYGLLPGKPATFSKILFYLQCQGMWAIADYRFRRWLLMQEAPMRTVLSWLWIPVHVLTECLTGISIPTGTQIGKGLYIGHFSGIFLHDDVVMGEGCNLSHEVTIGLGGSGEKLGVPRVGRNVYFGPGCKVFGKITIGDNVRIGANAVVFRSVPDGATAVGVPARIVGEPPPTPSRGAG